MPLQKETIPVTTATVQERARRAALLEKALAIYSPSGQEQQLAQLLFSELEEQGLQPRIDGAGNVLCTVGTGKTSLLFCGHMDTVPGMLPVTRKGELFSGRGACDAKGPLLSLLFAFETLARDPVATSLGRVTFAAVTEEERSSAGLKELIQQELFAEYAIFGEPAGLSKITIGYRGHLPTIIEVSTAEAHASAPWLATNSAELAFSLYETLRDHTFEKKGENVASVEQVSVALTGIHGESAHNVTPLHTQLTLDIRLPARIRVAQAQAMVESVLEEYRRKHPEAKLEVVFDDPTEAYRVKLDSQLVRAMSRALLSSNFRVKPTFIEKSATGDMNSYAGHFGSQAVTYGPGDTKLSHTAGEVVNLQEVLDCAEILQRTAIELFRMQK